MARTVQQMIAALNGKSGHSQRLTEGFCNAPHPDPRWTHDVEVDMGNGSMEVKQVHDVICRRFAEHDGDCSAYVTSIRVPETWPR